MSDSRRRLLDAGLSLLIEQDTQHWLRSLTARAVARRAGRTTGAFYAQWACQQDFVSDLVTYALDADELMSAWAVDHKMRHAASLGGSAGETFGALAHEALDRQLDTGSFTAMLALLSRHIDPGVRVGLADTYRVIEGAHVAAYREYFGVRCGLEPAPPLTWDDLGSAMSSALDGATVRHLIDAETFPRDRFPLIILAIAMAYLRPIGSSKTKADIAGGFDRLVAEAQEARRGSEPLTTVRNARRGDVERRVAIRAHTDRVKTARAVRPA